MDRQLGILVRLCLLAAMAIAMGCAGSRGRVANDSAAMEPVAEALDVEISISGPPTEAELAAAGPFQRTASGLKYRVLRPGEGRKPRATDTVRAHYHGWLDDGSVFDSSFQRGSPTSFGLQNVVPGWTEGLQYVGEGGRIQLEIPSFLGYGPEGRPGKIPPNATLNFVVELIAIES